ncbi:2-C-methyl-D-erythritol 2,4-cyclodiphosphate synthase [Anaeropeptidivorans aminofermentans]|uniref:2-C-methyl-D-erythritol 2,4-cyclodiphosphate synthase n=1 Tax=Anaeropeptidivorans aminofermentans TaxID=2934315 RepID=UPI002025A0B1|nr:2-C-methyl-D-erythritol 2,4-cyclodiphosphate synthase [Anaeropeptidivorans aminofermentans]
MSFRIGFGYDVHRLQKGRKLIIGGVEIAHEYGLLGHSDADVLTHAVMDALLGAAGKGDIGTHFPDTDEKYKDVSSIKLLCEVKNIIEDEGYKISNIDAVIVAQEPKISPYKEKIAAELSKALAIDKSQINIKATTEEKLGFTGDGSGMSAKAVALIEKI